VLEAFVADGFAGDLLTVFCAGDLREGVEDLLRSLAAHGVAVASKLQTAKAMKERQIEKLNCPPSQRMQIELLFRPIPRSGPQARAAKPQGAAAPAGATALADYT
jgi:hypothetical protein